MIGSTISHYKIIEKLGEGGMGVVYKAQDINLNRLVALKFLHTLFTKDKESRERFKTEAQAASALEHQNICNIHEIDESRDGQQFICMAYYEGTNLADEIKKGPLKLEDALGIIYQISQGLETAHNKKIVHCDIKPSNIIISIDGNVKILDFGLAKLIGKNITQTISTKGTIKYMAPEVIRGLPVDHRADMWSLGIILFEMLTGHIPFKGNFAEPLMYSIVNQKPKQLADFISEPIDSLQKIIDKLLQKDPKNRYKDISELIIDLEPLTKEYKSVAIKTKQVASKILMRSSLAVLPLKNITQDNDQEWFTDGMTDLLITELAQISGLRVISRNSAMLYKEIDKPLSKIADELGVKYLVEGSVVKVGNHIKVSARLIDIGEDEYIWAKKYEREFEDVLELQAEIAKEIAGQIEVQLTPHEENRLGKKRQINPNTYEAYLKGMYHINKYTPEGFTKGFDYLHKATENDPEEPLVYASLALAYDMLAHTPSSPPDALTNAKKYAKKALEIDENVAEAQLALGMCQVFADWDKKGAEKSYNRSLELNPSLALARAQNAFFVLMLGNKDKALEEITQAIQLDPLNPLYPAWHGWLCFWMERNDEAIVEALKSIELVPDFPIGLYVLGCAYAAKGMFNDAIEVHKKAGNVSPDFKWALGQTYALAGRKNDAVEVAAELESQSKVWETWGIAEIYAALGDKDKAFYWLEKAFVQHHAYIQWIKRNPSLKSLCNDPRFQDLAERLNLPK
jgi:serine/threonine protein kinase